MNEQMKSEVQNIIFGCIANFVKLQIVLLG